MKTIRSCNGITLLEIILSLGILAIILLPTLSIFAASITNNRFSQDAIEAKYSAEKYAEIIKSARIDTLEGLLTGTCGFDFVSSTGIYANDDEGIEIAISRFGGYKTSGDRSYNFEGRILDIGEIAGEITIDIAEETLGIRLTTNPAVLANGYDTADDPQPYLDTKVYSECDFELRFNGSNSNRVIIDNQSDKKVTFYCVNQGKKEYDTSFYKNRALPNFTIKSGEAAFCDLTVTPDDERLPEETDDMFKGAEELPLAYRFIIRVIDKNAIPIYTLEGMKTVY